jgi:hypothetical protein
MLGVLTKWYTHVDLLPLGQYFLASLPGKECQQLAATQAWGGHLDKLSLVVSLLHSFRFYNCLFFDFFFFCFSFFFLVAYIQKPIKLF